MKFFKVFFVTLLLVVVVVVAGGYYFLKNLDLNKYSPKIVELVEKNTGRKFRLGSVDIKPSLLPTLIVTDVSLSNADWAHDANMIEAKSIELQVALKPLLDKKIVVKNFVLDDAKIYLQTNEKGEGNWVFEISKKTQTTSFKFELISSANATEVSKKINIPDIGLENIVISSGFVSFNEHDVDINSFKLSMPNKSSKISADFDVAYNGEPINGSSVIGSVDDLLNKKPYSLDIKINGFGFSAKFVGNINNMLDKNINILGDLNVYNPASNFELPEVSLQAKINAFTTNANIEIASLSVAKNIIKGRVSANYEQKPFVDAYFSSDKFDLQSLSDKEVVALKLPSLIATANATKLVSPTPIDYSMFNLFDGKLIVNMKNFVINKEIAFDKVDVTANLGDGVLLLKPVELDVKGGKIFATASLDSAIETMNINIETKGLEIQNLDTEFVVKDDKDFGIKSGGEVDFMVELITNGKDLKQLAERLNGRVIAIANPSVIQTGNSAFFDGFLGSVLKAIKLNDTQKNKEVDLTCAVVRSDVKDGIFNFPKGIAIQSKDLSLVANGYVSLGNDAISLDLHPYAKDIANTSLASTLGGFVKIVGTIDKPAVAIDEKQALKSIVGVLTTGGIASAAEQVSDSTSSPCYTALAGTGFENRFPKPAVVNQVIDGSAKTVDKSVEELKGAVKDLGKNLGELFKSF